MIRKSVVIILMLAMLLTAVVFPAAAEDGQQDMDIVLVIDCSGSMLSADPGKLALTGANMFIDLNKDSDWRVGYVMYTHEIVADLSLTPIKPIDQNDPVRQLLKNSILDKDYKSNGDTDIALGLERAYELLKEDPSSRKQAIILLGDGNTHLPANGPRTTNESLIALENIKSTLAGENIPVYTIGLNHDGKLDVESMADIANLTGGMAQEVKTSDQLLTAVNEIYRHIGNLSGEGPTEHEVTGGWQEDYFTIEDESVYKATITINGSLPILEGYLTSPDGTMYDETDTTGTLTVDKDQSGKYLLLSLYNPQKGDWTLNFMGTKGDTVLIDRFYLYDLNLVMDTPVTEFGKATISWQLQDNEGNRITDQALINSAGVTLYIDGEDPYDFPAGQQSETFELEPGEYTAHLTLTKEGLEQKESNSRTFSVPDAPCPELKDRSADTVYVSLTTLFDTETEFYIEDYVSYESHNLPLSVSIKSDEDYLELDYDRTDGRVSITALKSGHAEAVISIKGARDCGHDADVILYIDANIGSGWIYIIIAGAVLLLIAAGIIIFLLVRRPYLDTPIREIPIQVGLPDSQIENTPPEAFLRLPHVKGKKTLREIIMYNREHSSQYSIAFEGITWFTNGMVFSAKRSDALEVLIPANNLFVTRVDNRNQAGPCTVRLFRNGRLTVELARRDYNEEIYQIILGSGGLTGAETVGGDDPFAIVKKDSGGGSATSFDGFDF